MQCSPKDIDDEVLDRYGIRKKNDEKPKILEPQQCVMCGFTNSPTAKYC